MACTTNGTVSQGVDEARNVLASTALSVVSSPSVHGAVLTGDDVQLEVSGEAESIVPWLHLPVSAVRVGTKQEFRESE